MLYVTNHSRAFQAGNLMTTITAFLCQRHMKNLCARISWQARIVAGNSIKKFLKAL